MKSTMMRQVLIKIKQLTIIQKESHYQITEEGRKLLNDPSVKSINSKLLLTYKSFRDFHRSKKRIAQPVTEELSPEEKIIESYNELKESVKDELLELTLNLLPELFED